MVLLYPPPPAPSIVFHIHKDWHRLLQVPLLSNSSEAQGVRGLISRVGAVDKLYRRVVGRRKVWFQELVEGGDMQIPRARGVQVLRGGEGRIPKQFPADHLLPQHVLPAPAVASTVALSSSKQLGTV